MRYAVGIISRCIRPALAALALALLPACVQHPQPPLVFGANSWVGYEPFYLARELGYLPAAKIHLAEHSNASQVIRAFHNNLIQVAALTLDEALQLQQDVPDLRVILVTDTSNGADVILAQAGISRLQQLGGRRIGVENTAVGAYFLSLALNSVGMEARQLEIVPLSVDEHEEAFRSRRVDAVVTFEPVRSRLLDSDASLLFDSSQVPGKIVDVVVTREAYLRAHREQITLLLRGWAKAIDSLQRQPQHAVAIMAAHQGVATADIERAMAGVRLTSLAENRALLRAEQGELTQAVASVQGYLLQHELIKHKMPVADLLDDSILDRLGR